MLPPSDARKFERDLPHCERVAMIAGGGHCPQLLQTEAVVEELASFLSPYVRITEALVGGRVGNPRGLIVNVVPGPRGAQMSPDPGPTPGRPVAG